jgi:mannose-6-phosphate isomerase-like protein (cupin superfamily)
MAKGTVVHADKVMPFVPPAVEGAYESRMMIDVFNSSSEKMQVNHGTLKAGCSIPGSVHEGHDEIYIVVSGEAELDLDHVRRHIRKGTVVFIPGGVHHALHNTSKTEDLEIFTVWAGQPAPGANGVYDMRKEAWGTTYREVDE